MIDFIEDVCIPEDLPQASHVLLLGTGGSCLGAQALIHFNPQRLFFTFPDADPYYFYSTLKLLDPTDTQVLCISKSGETMETLAQFLAILEWLPSYENIRCITQPGESTLRKIASQYDIKIYDHPPHIGGRFSVFTLTGLIPMHLNDMDVESFLKGAKQALTHPPEIFTSSQHVLWIYSQRLRPIGQWWAQLVAESLGKKDKKGKRYGVTPLVSFGTQDQHSQLQYYLDGPLDKAFTFLCDAQASTPPLKGIRDCYLVGKTMGDIYAAHQNATMETLKKNKIPVQTFSIETEYDLGFFMMKSFQDVVATARQWGIDPYDQPAVEEGKRLAREYVQLTVF